MLYTILLGIGALGLLAQTALGHLHDGDGGAGHDHDGDGIPDGGAGSHGHESASPWMLLSPLRLFSFSLGAGAGGLIFGSAVRSPWALALVAGLAGIAFYRFVVKPLWRVAQKFASRPAENLSAAVAREAVAASRFDERGRGIVSLIVDGHVVRLLAQLEESAPVSPGDRLTITRVDGARNTCRVTKL